MTGSQKRSSAKLDKLLSLETVHYDPMARGTWCALPYHGHPRGCPNLSKGCIRDRPDFKDIARDYTWFAVVEEFDLNAHAKMMKLRHPDWTVRQCRNPLYWQGAVRAKLRAKAEYAAGQINEYGHYLKNENLILDIPEACGIDVFQTMAGVGVILDRTPDIVRKVMIVGVPA